jgi:hypothetical protein
VCVFSLWAQSMMPLPTLVIHVSDASDAALFTPCLPSDDNVCPDSNDDADVADDADLLMMPMLALRRRLISKNFPMLLYTPLLCSSPFPVPETLRRCDFKILYYYYI